MAPPFSLSINIEKKQSKAMNILSGRECATVLDGALPLSTNLREALAGHGHKARNMARLSRILHPPEGKLRHNKTNKLSQFMRG